MADYTVRTRKVMTNKLLHRKQMVVEVIHPGLPNASRELLREKLSKFYKVRPDQVMVYGLRTVFGGGHTSGFALVYDTKEHLLKTEPKHKLKRDKYVDYKRVGRKLKKERKNKQKKIRGTGKSKVGLGAKK
jgi:small subunit ribosomal protein S24e